MREPTQRQTDARSRRLFLKQTLAVAGASILGTDTMTLGAKRQTPTAAPRPFVGIQIAAHSFYDEGIEYCLDMLQETAGINGLLISSHSYYGAMGRPLEVMADHGVPKADNSKRKLPRVWVKHHEKYFTDTKLRHRDPAPDALYSGREVFTDLADAAIERGMRLYARHYQPSKEAARYIEGFAEVLAQDHDGKPHYKPCWNNPDYRGYLLGTMRDMFESYPLDGLQYGAERPTPLTDVLFKGTGFIFFCPDRTTVIAAYCTTNQTKPPAVYISIYSYTERLMFIWSHSADRRNWYTIALWLKDAERSIQGRKHPRRHAAGNTSRNGTTGWSENTDPPTTPTSSRQH